MMDLSKASENKTATATYVAPTATEKEKLAYDEFIALQKTAKSRGLEMAKVRKYKVVDVLFNKSYTEIVVGMEDYIKDKFVYLGSIRINDKETPRLFNHVNTEVKRLSADWKD